MSNVYLDYLEHYGVKGMKWGIRKERPTAGRKIPHMVLIPKDQAVGLDSIEDVIDKFGPRLESEYQRFVENGDS